MAVIMIAEVPGAGADFIEGIREAGVPAAMVKAPGFVSHVSGASATGFRVIEVWETKEAHQDWYDSIIAPNLPPGVGQIETEYIDLALTLPESRE